MPFPTPKTSLASVETTLMDSITTEAFLASMDLKLYDHLKPAPQTAGVLAKTLNLKESPLAALLDILVAKDILTNGEQGYANSLMAEEYLVSTSPLYQGTAIQMQRKHNEQIRTNLFPMLKGESPQRKNTDESWGHAETMNATLQHALNGQIQVASEFIATLAGFDDLKQMADVGGNHGQYSMELLDKNPGMHSTIFDLPNVVGASSMRCEALGYGDRIACEPFDLLKDSLPEASFDLVFVSHILYACANDLDTAIAKLFKALKPGGYLASHHFAPEGGASEHYKTNVQFITTLLGYDSHFLPRSSLETAMHNAGFTEMHHTFTGKDGQTLLLVGRK